GNGSMLGEATLDALKTFLGEAGRIPILIVAPFLSSSPRYSCSHCAPQAMFGHHNSAAPRATSMPRWWQSRVRSSGSGPAVSTRVPTVTVIRRDRPLSPLETYQKGGEEPFLGYAHRSGRGRVRVEDPPRAFSQRANEKPLRPASK